MSRPFCWPRTMTGRPSKKAMPATIAAIVGKRAVAVNLHEIREQALDVIERMRTLGMSGELHPFPRGIGLGLCMAAAAD